MRIDRIGLRISSGKTRMMERHGEFSLSDNIKIRPTSCQVCRPAGPTHVQEKHWQDQQKANFFGEKDSTTRSRRGYPLGF